MDVKSMPLVVQKYGGTSVEDPEKIMAVANHIKKTADSKHVVVVVSAMGQSTDEIIELMEAVNPDCPEREMAQALHTGEILSAALLAAALKKIGCQARSMTSHQMRLVASGEHTKGRIIEIQGIEETKKILSQGEILVCAGFQGISSDQEIITLGRGGSDTTAVALAYTLGAESCEIYTDVDGVYALDPRVVLTAKRFDFITFGEMLQMSAAGAGVLMDRAVTLARDLNVPLRVLISPSKGETTGGSLVSYRDPSESHIETNSVSRLGLAIRKKVVIITVFELVDKPGVAADIFEAVSDFVIGDAIQGQSQKKATIYFWVDIKDIEAVKNRLQDKYQIEIGSGRVCLTLVGSALKEGKGYLARLTRALADAEVNIEMISTSGTSILLIIAEEKLQQAAMAVAQKFDLCS